MMADTGDATDSGLICAIMDGDSRALIPLAEHERVRRGNIRMAECLAKIADALNDMVAQIENEDAEIAEETQPAPLGE